MNSPDTEMMIGIKNELAQQYHYDNFDAMLKDNCKTSLIAAAISNIVDYVAIEYQRKSEKAYREYEREKERILKDAKQV